MAAALVLEKSRQNIEMNKDFIGFTSVAQAS
jgi:hypothetical protein